jgi:pimeloyl-ACP methyl ester carboxylesterase
MVDITEEFVQLGDVRLNVASAGPTTGPPVLLLHGFPDSWQLWRPQLEALANAGHRVIAPDLRGFGQSDRPEDTAAYRMPVLVGDVVGVLDHYGVERAAVIGHDWGAALAWQVAFRQAARVTRLVAISVGHGGTSASAGIAQRQASWYMLWFLFPGVAEDVLPRNDWQFFREWAWNGAAPGENEACDRQIAELSRPGALVAALNIYRANILPARFVPTDEVAGPLVSCPTLGVWSSGDAFLTEAQMTQSARFVTGEWRYEQLPGHHWVPAGAPAELATLLVDWLG